jgi:hypothetical protein
MLKFTKLFNVVLDTIITNRGRTGMGAHSVNVCDDTLGAEVEARNFEEAVAAEMVLLAEEEND